jgi:hypothetical protein
MSTDLFEFVADLVRAQHASVVPLRPRRPVDWNTLTRTEKLDAAEKAVRRPLYSRAMLEALPEHARYDQWLGLMLDSNVSDEQIGRFARDMCLHYLKQVADAHNEVLEP